MTYVAGAVVNPVLPDAVVVGVGDDGNGCTRFALVAPRATAVETVPYVTTQHKSLECTVVCICAVTMWRRGGEPDLLRAHSPRGPRN